METSKSSFCSFIIGNPAADELAVHDGIGRVGEYGDPRPHSAVNEVGRLETEYHRIVMGSPDAREGVLAWLERRDPKWTGRP